MPLRIGCCLDLGLYTLLKFLPGQNYIVFRAFFGTVFICRVGMVTPGKNTRSTDSLPQIVSYIVTSQDWLHKLKPQIKKSCCANNVKVIFCNTKKQVFLQSSSNFLANRICYYLRVRSIVFFFFITLKQPRDYSMLMPIQSLHITLCAQLFIPFCFLYFYAGLELINNINDYLLIERTKKCSFYRVP